MPLSDYAHWNEDQYAVWWAEEGRHDPDQERQDAYDPDDYLDDGYECRSVEECLKGGNFSTRDEVLWECDCCGQGYSFAKDRNDFIIHIPELGDWRNYK